MSFITPTVGFTNLPAQPSKVDRVAYHIEKFLGRPLNDKERGFIQNQQKEARKRGETLSVAAVKQGLRRLAHERNTGPSPSTSQFWHTSAHRESKAVATACQFYDNIDGSRRMKEAYTFVKTHPGFALIKIQGETFDKVKQPPIRFSDAPPKMQLIAWGPSIGVDDPRYLDLRVLRGGSWYNAGADVFRAPFRDEPDRSSVKLGANAGFPAATFFDEGGRLRRYDDIKGSIWEQSGTGLYPINGDLKKKG